MENIDITYEFLINTCNLVENVEPKSPTGCKREFEIDEFTVLTMVQDIDDGIGVTYEVRFLDSDQGRYFEVATKKDIYNWLRMI